MDIKRTLFIAETERDSDYYRWMGFKQAMEKKGGFCSRSRYIVVPGEKKYRLRKYEELLPRFLEAKALAFSSDYDAIEAMNFFFDKGIRVPDQISITGYDDSMYASMVRPKLTTVHQDVQKKAHIALKRLMKLIQGEELKELNIKKSGLFSKEGFCQRMTESFFFVNMHKNRIKTLLRF